MDPKTDFVRNDKTTFMCLGIIKFLDFVRRPVF
jgi:hypothetical protein